MHKILTQYWESDERQHDYMAKINKNPEYVQIREKSAELYQGLINVLDKENFGLLESDNYECLAMTEKTAFELGFEYACQMMQALGFGGVVNG